MYSTYTVIYIYVRAQLVLPDTLEHFYKDIIHGKRLYTPVHVISGRVHIL